MNLKAMKKFTLKTEKSKRKNRRRKTLFRKSLKVCLKMQRKKLSATLLVLISISSKLVLRA